MGYISYFLDKINRNINVRVWIDFEPFSAQPNLILLNLFWNYKKMLLKYQMTSF